MIRTSLLSREQLRSRRKFAQEASKQSTGNERENKLIIKTSWDKLVEFSTEAGKFMMRSANDTDTKTNKLIYAIRRTMMQLEKLKKQVDNALSEIQVDTCYTERRGEEDILVRDNLGNLQYSKEGLLKRNARSNAFLAADNFEIDRYIASDIPDNLLPEEIEAFRSLVITDEQADAAMARCEDPSAVSSTLIS